MKLEGTNLHVTNETYILNANKIDITFSPDGKWFSLFRVKNNILRIFKIDNDDVSDIIRKVEKELHDKEFYGNPLLAPYTEHGYNDIR
jgi:hypothetical protein